MFANGNELQLSVLLRIQLQGREVTSHTFMAITSTFTSECGFLYCCGKSTHCWQRSRQLLLLPLPQLSATLTWVLEALLRHTVVSQRVPTSRGATVPHLGSVQVCTTLTPFELRSSKPWLLSTELHMLTNNAWQTWVLFQSWERWMWKYSPLPCLVCVHCPWMLFFNTLKY